jgi:acyl carrier protein
MVLDTVKEVIASQLELDVNDITRESSLTEDLKADSVDVVGIIMKLESEFNLEFPYEELETIATVGDAVDYIEANKG